MWVFLNSLSNNLIALIGKIQIDVHTYSKLDKQQLEAAFIVEKREPFEIKGKGICETYFLTPKIPSDHADEYFNPQDPE